MTSDKLPFVILAGSPPERDALMEYSNVDFKALIDICGKPMLTRIIEAVLASDLASYILFVGIPHDLVPLLNDVDPALVDYVEMEGKPTEKIIGAAKYLLEKSKSNPNIFPTGKTTTVILAGDIPAVTADVIKYFVEQTGERDKGFYYSTVERSVMETAFPQSGRSWIRLDGKDYCGGDMHIFDVQYAEQSEQIMNIIFENRKSFVTALFKAAPFIFIKYILKLVSLKDVERLMTKVFKFPSGVVISKYAEIAFDVDKPFQLDLMREHLGCK